MAGRAPDTANSLCWTTLRPDAEQAGRCPQATEQVKSSPQEPPTQGITNDRTCSETRQWPSVLEINNRGLRSQCWGKESKGICPRGFSSLLWPGGTCRRNEEQELEGRAVLPSGGGRGPGRETTGQEENLRWQSLEKSMENETSLILFQNAGLKVA